MQITVQTVNRPNKNPKYGSIKSTDGVYYDIGATVLDRYRQGMTFDAPVKSREWQNKTYYSIPDSFDPGMADTAGQVMAKVNAPNGHASPATPAGNGYVPELDKQGYITCAVIMKILVDAQLHGGKPVDTQDLPLFAQAAVATWRDHIKGKV